MSNDQVLAAAALKRLAADPVLSTGFRAGGPLRSLLQASARRYVVAADAPTAVRRMQTLADKGYAVGMEYVGENVTDRSEVARIAAQYSALIATLPQGGLCARTELNFDLSNVGLLISPELALKTSDAILAEAAARGLFVTISMERASMVDSILEVFHELAARHVNVGITLQAYLHRTPDDLARVLATGRKVRLVKGVYQEGPEHALPRSAALDERYIDLAQRLHAAGVAHTFATQDRALVAALRERGLLDGGAELEMLHGVQPAFMRLLKQDGVNCRVYGTFGENWYLHLLHRLAEAPMNVLQALGDFEQPSRVVFGGEY